VKVLVFGRSGQVARALAAAEPNVITLDRTAADLSDPDACAAAITNADADAVINAAAFTAVDRAENEPDSAHRINADAPGAMARAAAERNLPFLHISTDYVFPGTGHAPFREDDATGPVNIYGASKLDGERAVRSAGGRHVILRTSWVFDDAGANFMTTMLRLGRERDRLRVVADQVGGPTPAPAIAAALLRMAAALRDGHAGGTYHFAGAPDVSWADFARAILRSAGSAARIEDIPSEEYPTPAPRPRNSRLDCTAIGSDFGITRPDWRDAVALWTRLERA
jgi:dTDP-4-dehydrorhamnose reductase